jgi:hypothetical protein
VAVVTVSATGEVRRVFAGRCNSIVARVAAAQYLRMVDSVRRQPGNRVVAVFADGCRLYVRTVLAGRVRSIVATCAVAHDIYVVEVGWNPARCCVAVVTVIAALNMIGVFASCDTSVVTGAATPQHIQVVDCEHRTPGAGAMAVLAGGRGLDVCR